MCFLGSEEKKKKIKAQEVIGGRDVEKDVFLSRWLYQGNVTASRKKVTGDT